MPGDEAIGSSRTNQSGATSGFCWPVREKSRRPSAAVKRIER